MQMHHLGDQPAADDAYLEPLHHLCDVATWNVPAKLVRFDLLSRLRTAHATVPVRRDARGGRACGGRGRASHDKLEVEYPLHRCALEASFDRAASVANASSAKTDCGCATVVRLIRQSGDGHVVEADDGQVRHPNSRAGRQSRSSIAPRSLEDTMPVTRVRPSAPVRAELRRLPRSPLRGRAANGQMFGRNPAPLMAFS